MKLTHWWQKHLHPEQLRLSAGQRTYARGQHYLNTWRVLSAELTGDVLIAQVQGTQLYQVRIWRRNTQLQTACTCPFAAEGAFCKHAVAAALAVNRQENEKDFPAS
ncbi:MAG: SWIM zinc finger family protein [Blastocatellia bacterium]